MDNNTDEIWKDIKLWPLHQVSNRGRVRALPGARVGNRVAVEIEIRKLSPMSLSDRHLSLRQNKLLRRVHHLVLEAFVGPCPPGQECRHLNGDPADNRWPENIAWGTREENQDDRVGHGTSNRGTRHGMSKLTESEALEIRRSHGTQSEIAKKYGIAQSVVSRIRSGRAWGSIREYGIPEIKQMHLIPDMEPIEFPQMMLSFGG